MDDAALRTMYDFEMSGQDFYLGLAATATDETAAVLLTRNGREEAGHARRLGRALALVLGEPFVPAVVEPPTGSSSGPAPSSSGSWRASGGARSRATRSTGGGRPTSPTPGWPGCSPSTVGRR